VLPLQHPFYDKKFFIHLYNLEMWDGEGAWTGLIWLRIGTTGGGLLCVR
jgi:hypothetical protein